MPGHVPGENEGQQRQLFGEDDDSAHVQGSAGQTVFPQHDVLTDDGWLGFLKLLQSFMWRKSSSQAGDPRVSLSGLSAGRGFSASQLEARQETHWTRNGHHSGTPR